ncbi:Hypothetical predicted protein [Pelobates cultripes]|nr:Hypothetical predicted protein [Pelobates cultripes]
MVTKQDLQVLTTTLHDFVATTVTALRSDGGAQETCIQALKAQTQASTTQTRATDTALARQGAMLLALGRQTQDLDNRSRRSNIRVCSVPEPQGEEDAEGLLTTLFSLILGEEGPDQIQFDRAHRALRQRILDGAPHGLICCLHSYQLKEKIMRKARSRPSWHFQDSDVIIYNDLSPMGRPITQALRDKQIPFKWGFPFCLQARYNNEWAQVRWPEEVPSFLQKLELNLIEVPN